MTPRRALVLLGSAALVGSMTSAAPAVGRSGAAARATRPPTTASSESGGDDLVAYDARQALDPGARAVAARSATAVATGPSARRLERSLGSTGVFELDPTTGTVRILERLGGYLSGPSGRPARAVALSYVHQHHAALGLSGADLATLRLRRDYVDIAGTHHLSWIQEVGGTVVFGSGLQAAVARGGRLLTVGGSPVPKAAAPTDRAVVLGTPADAIAAARQDGAEPSVVAGPDDTAEPVVFVAGGQSHAAWQTITMSADRPTLAVFDSTTGQLLYRRPLGHSERGGHSRGLAVDYFPGHRPGGTPETVDLTARHWLPAGADRLFGNNAHAYSDVNDDDKAEAGEEAPPRPDGTWNYRLKPFHLQGVSFCDHPYPCSWNPNKKYSWRVNRKQNATQVFAFVNTWHDHLQAAPIGFTEAAGNFQARNSGRPGRGGDYVDTQTMDGASVDHGLPDGSHVDNANMSTPPDGRSPRMQMYLQHAPGTSYPDGDPFAPTNVGDEADTVYHEYTHGLSERLVVDADGLSTLGGVQAGAMGEAWSDWYAMDYLVDQGLQQDRRGKVDVILFQYDGAGVALDRTEPMDCPVGSTADRCNGGLAGHPGGYTYRDYGLVGGGPEVHSDGEIWAQTLWQLRDRLGSRTTESLVTRAMELAPHDPSYLDMRNAILVADTAVFGGRHQREIWRLFAARGMGYYAGSLDGQDTRPAASFARPPATHRTGRVTGVVTDTDTGRPVADATVTLAFQGRGLVNPTAVTDASGHYEIGPVPRGHYGKLVVDPPGYEPARSAVSVGKHGGHQDFTSRRDWAAVTGGAAVTDVNGPDFSRFECGPANAIDLSTSNGWGSSAGDDRATPTNVFVPKHLTVKLPQAVTVTELAVDPSATCGDGGSASTGAYRIETSPDGTTWTTADQGMFTPEDRGSLVPLTPTAGTAAVRFVRFTILGNQVPAFATDCPGGNFSGCQFADLTELEVYGTPS